MLTKFQLKKAIIASRILNRYKLVYLAMEERVGKSYMAMYVAEESTAKKILVITKKKALIGWEEVLNFYPFYKKYDVINYHKASKVDKKYDLIILDEAHNYLSSYPKPGKIWKDVKRLTDKNKIIYLSATPYAQGMQQLYHQLALSDFSPWKKYKNFYRWFDKFGIPQSIKVNGLLINQYNKTMLDDVSGSCDHLFVTASRKDFGFIIEPYDVPCYLEIDKKTKKIYNELLLHGCIKLEGVGDLICDNSMKLRTSLHQLEGGTIKIGDKRYILDNDEKLIYILRNFKDSESLVIMHNYVAERDKLEKYFTKATILQATSYAEGIDLHKFNNLVIYSQDFSTSKHTQRRARQCNMLRQDPINILLV